MASADKELEDRLRDVGSRLSSPPTAVDELLPLLDEAESLLSRVEQSPSQSMLNALQPTMDALVVKELLGYSDTDIKVAVTSCISEVTRITAPDAPYNDDIMKELFLRIVESFKHLDDMSSPSYEKRVLVLETVAKVRSCVVMLDLECDNLILDMFHHFLKTVSLLHPENVVSSMETIMTLVIEESEDISPKLVSCLLDSVKLDNKLSSQRLGEKVISTCAVKLKPILMEIVKDIPLSKYSKIVSSLCQENSDALEHNDADASADDTADSKLSERTISDELPQGSAKLQQEVGRPEEFSTVVSKSSGVIMNTGTVQLGGGGSNKLTPCQGGQSESTVLGNAEPDKLESAAVKPDSDGKKIRGRKTDCCGRSTEATDCHKVNSDEETIVVPGGKKGPKREADSAQFINPSAKDIDSSLSLDRTKIEEFQAPLRADDGTDIASQQIENLPDSAQPKGGQHRGSKIYAKRGHGDMATNDVVPHSSLKRVVGNDGTQVHVLSSEISDSKELQDIINSEEKSVTGLARTGRPKSATVHKKLDIITSESDPKSQGLAAKTGSARNGSKEESSQKQQKSNFKQRGKVNSDDDKTREPSLKNFKEIANKRKRGDGNKGSASMETKHLDESLVGSKIKVWWPDDKRWCSGQKLVSSVNRRIIGRFYDGVVGSYNTASKKHKILYDDGDVEILHLKKETWELIEGHNESDGGQAKDLRNPDVSPEMLPSETSAGQPHKMSKVETPKSGKELKSDQGKDIAQRRGRPKSGTSKIVISEEDGSLKSTGKSMEKAVVKGKEGTPKTGTKHKMDPGNQSKDGTETDGPISKDDISKSDAKSTRNISNDHVAKAGGKSKDHTLRHTSKPKDDVSSAGKNRKSTTKSLSSKHTLGIHQKSKSITVPKIGEGSKTDDSALERKPQESEASSAKKRKRSQS